MKLALLIALTPLLLRAAAPEAQEAGWTINGQVLAAQSDGILVTCRGESTPNLKQPPAGEIVFVKGKFSFAKGDTVNLIGEPIGRHPYASADDPTATVRAFEIRH